MTIKRGLCDFRWRVLYRRLSCWTMTYTDADFTKVEVQALREALANPLTRVLEVELCDGRVFTFPRGELPHPLPGTSRVRLHARGADATIVVCAYIRDSGHIVHWRTDTGAPTNDTARIKVRAPLV